MKIAEVWAHLVPKAPSLDAKGAEGYPPLQLTRGPGLKLNFVKSECQKTILLTNILLNFLAYFCSGCRAV